MTAAHRLRMPRAPAARFAWRRPVGGLAMLAVAAALLAPGAAHAEAVSDAELRALAAQAAEDPAALERLRAVDQVDGRAVALAAALDASGAELEARLDALATPAATTGGDADAARAEAADIVSGRRFTGTEVPGPFRGAIEEIADWIAPLLDLVPALDDLLPGGRPVVWALLVLAIGALAAVLAGRSLRRRTAAHGARAAPPSTADDPDALDRAAREAAARGDHELALRLGFRAGLARLALGESLSTGEVARTLGSPAFDRAATRFDEVVYGGRPAGAADVDEAREAWRTVIAGRRRA